MTRREFIALRGGAAGALPLALRAQQKAMPVIGFLCGGASGAFGSAGAAFRQGLSETGYVEGQNVTIEYRWADGRYDALPGLAADLVARKVDVIAAIGGTPPALAAKKRYRDDPDCFRRRRSGRVGPSRQSRPTGGQPHGLQPSRSRADAQAARTALRVGSRGQGYRPPCEPEQRSLRADRTKRPGSGAREGVQLLILNARTESEIHAAFLVELQAGALLVGGDPLFDTRLEQLVTLASRHAVPAIYPAREFVAAGGLISYGASRTGGWRQEGTYVGKILGGAKPADLPVQQPTTFELVVNLKTAKELGLTIPPSILARADEAIE